MKKIACSIGLALWVSGVIAQDTLVPPPWPAFAFLRAEDNAIENRVSLTPFFERLHQLAQQKDRQVNILHLGDSHIQADFLSGHVRELLQRYFGNGGRGLVFPGRVARTNEPLSIYSKTNGPWDVKRIVFTDQSMPIGIYPVTLQTTQPGTRLELAVRDAAGLPYAFSKMTLFFQKTPRTFHLAVRDSAGRELAYAGAYTQEEPTHTSTLAWGQPIRKVELQTLKALDEQQEFTLFGISLENQQPGLLYHASGGNGAKFRHFAAASEFSVQSSALHPDLIIVSLGTNEAVEYPYLDRQLEQQMEEVINSLRRHNPSAVFLITTPPESFKRKTRRNPGVEVIRDKLIAFAEKNQLAYWDLYAAGGAPGQAEAWRRHQLMQADGIHFTRAGYEVQGTLLVHALITAYNEYIRYRYP